MSLIKTTIDMPFLRKGSSFTFHLETEGRDGAVVFPASGLTMTCKVKANTAGSTLTTATITRVSDFVATITLTSAEVDTICAGLTFSLVDLEYVAKCIFEITLTYTTPAETITLFLKPDVVQ